MEGMVILKSVIGPQDDPWGVTIKQMDEWNIWTKKSVELLEKGYLDQLLKIYKGKSGAPKKVPEEAEKKLHEAYRAYEEAQGSLEAKKKLVEALLNARKETNRSPFNHPYLPLVYYLVSEEMKSGKTLEEALEVVASKHPGTIITLAEEARKRNVGALLQRLKEPPEINRQIGPMFKSWYKKKLKDEIEGRFSGPTSTPKVAVVSVSLQARKGQAPLIKEEKVPESTDIILYTGSDKALENLAKKNLGLGEKEKLGTKGIDLYVIIRRNPEEVWHLTGEAKLQSDFGGNQDNQKLVAGGSIRLDLEKRHVGIMLIDGMPIVSKFHGWEELNLSKNTIVASALLLPDLIAELYQKGEGALGL